jgi:hypothetical protein
MNIMVVDTETTNLEKPFCYNIGYVIANTETKEILVRKEFVVEQVWKNQELFSTAYYVDKRPIYVNRMRARAIKMDKIGYITQEIARDIKFYEIEQVYAYNSPFDQKVFEFNSEWYKIINPFELTEFYDIRGYVHEFLAETEQYQDFCDKHKLYTESGNYSTTAETVFRFITDNVDFNEEHTALADSEIELEILFECVEQFGAKFGEHYAVKRSIERNVEKHLIIVQDGTETDFTYRKRTNRGDKIYLKG